MLFLVLRTLIHGIPGGSEKACAPGEQPGSFRAVFQPMAWAVLKVSEVDPHGPELELLRSINSGLSLLFYPSNQQQILTFEPKLKISSLTCPVPFCAAQLNADGMY